MSTKPDILPPDRPKPRKGERAAQIRMLADRYPGLPRAAIARKVGCTPSNVTTVLNTYLNGTQPAELTEFQSSKAQIYDALQHRVLSSITHEKLDKANLLQTVTAAAILEDKSRLAQGQPTSYHVTALLDVLDLVRQQGSK